MGRWARFGRACGLAGALSVLLGGASPPTPATYAFTEASEVRVTARHWWAGARRGGAHVITGNLAVAGEALQLPARLEVPIGAFTSDEPADALAAGAALDAAAWPTARLHIERIDLAWKTYKPGRIGGRLDFAGTAHGELGLRGVMRPIAFPIEGWALPVDAHVSARFPVSLSAYGIPAPRLFFFPIDDRVEIEVEAVARRLVR